MTKRTLLIIGLIGSLSCSTAIRSIESPQVATEKVPRNVILMIGDGMGLSQITAAMYNSRRKLNLERFQNIGFQKTHCKDKLVTDSAAAAAAMARGIKSDEHTFGTSEKEKAPLSILEILHEKQWATGMVVTSSLTHATPAAFVTYQLNRSMNEEIAMDFLQVEVDYLVGGGKQYFDRRGDQRDLIKEWKDQDVIVKSFLEMDFLEVNPLPSKRFVYFTADSEPLSRSSGRTYLPNASSKGVLFLERRSEKGFFLMIEGSQIDWGGHANLGEYIVDELLDFDETIGLMLDYAQKNQETLLIVTADHETGGMAITGTDDRNKLTYAFVSKNHTADLIPVFAFGPGSNLFTGIYENTDIPKRIKEALKLNTENK